MTKASEEYQEKASWLSILTQPGYVSHYAQVHSYPQDQSSGGSRLVSFFENDSANPQQFPPWLQWVLCCVAGYVTFSVAFISSAYTSSVSQIANELQTSPEVATFGLSLYLIGFSLGPLLWAPASEALGRQPISITSSVIHVAVNVGACFSPNIHCLLLLRFVSGAFGAAPLTNSGGIIADTFPPATRGLAITVYAIVPLVAPVLGPIIGGPVTESFGWRGLMVLMAVLSATSLLAILIALPETYAPVLLRKRAKRISEITNLPHISALDAKVDRPPTLCQYVLSTLARPWHLAAHEPIISLLAVYQAIVFGTLYLTFAAFPIVYGARGWSPGMIGLSFVGVLVGTLLAVAFEVWNNRRFVRALRAGRATPESRLLGCCIGGTAIVLGLFVFAGTADDARVPAAVSVAAGAPFGFGVVLATIGSTNYLVDAYTTYAASALTVCIVARAVFAAAFTLCARHLFHALGVRGAMTLPAAMALVCLPGPFLLSRFGPAIRARCPFAAKSGSVYGQSGSKVEQQKDEEEVNETTRLLPSR